MTGIRTLSPSPASPSPSPNPQHRAPTRAWGEAGYVLLLLAAAIRLVSLVAAAYLLIYSVVHAAPNWCDMPTASQCMTVDSR